MGDFTILAMTVDVDWLQPVRHDLQDLGGTRLIVAGSMQEACELLEMASARLVLLNWDSDRADYEQIGNLLWTNSTLTSPAMVLVIANDYRADQALTLFRMGVDEYVCRADHAEKLQGVLGQLLTGRVTASNTQSRTLRRHWPVREPLPRSPRWAGTGTESVASGS
jgi:DNA-binding NarL/FixJ family response regulator